MSNQQLRRPAVDVIAELRRGKCSAELTDHLADLVTACLDTGKKGELVLKLTLEPDDLEEGRMSVIDQIAVKTPRRTQKPSLFFIDGDSLTRRDPQQDPLPTNNDNDDDGDSNTAGVTSIKRKKA